MAKMTTIIEPITFRHPCSLRSAAKPLPVNIHGIEDSAILCENREQLDDRINN